MSETPHSRFLHVYAIVRFDFPLDTSYPTNTATVVKVFVSKQAADQEASRLNQLNADKHCHYEVFTTRLVDGLPSEVE